MSDEGKIIKAHKSTVPKKFAYHIDKMQIRRELFCNNLHPYMTMGEIRLSMDAVGFHSE